VGIPGSGGEPAEARALWAAGFALDGAFGALDELFPQEIEALYRMLKLPIPTIEGKRGRIGKSKVFVPYPGLV